MTASLQGHDETVASTVGRTAPSRSASHRSHADKTHKNDAQHHALLSNPALSPATVKLAVSLFDSAKSEPSARCITLPALREVLASAGYAYSLSEVKDLVSLVQQTQGVLKRNAQADVEEVVTESRPTPSSELLPVTVAAPKTEVSEAGQVQETAAAVDLITFVEVFAANLTDNNPEQEYRRVWAAMDADGDGILSAADVAKTFHELNLPPLGAEEMNCALEQADFDCDGLVKFEDFLMSMDSM